MAATTKVVPNSKKREKKGGRVAGTPNKTTGELKEMILKALDNAGGIDYLTRQADENPKAFLTLVGKVLPMQVTGEGGGALRIVLEASDAAL